MADCFYCDPNSEGRQALMVRVGQLRESVVYLFKDQAHKGRCVVAANEHKSELSELTPEKRHAYMDDVSDVAAAIKKLWGCTKVNYGAFGDKMPHLHFHIVPKYEDGFEFGGSFAIANENPVYLPDDEFAEMIAQLKAELHITED